MLGSVGVSGLRVGSARRRFGLGSVGVSGVGSVGRFGLGGGLGLLGDRLGLWRCRGLLGHRFGRDLGGRLRHRLRRSGLGRRLRDGGLGRRLWRGGRLGNRRWRWRRRFGGLRCGCGCGLTGLLLGLATGLLLGLATRLLLGLATGLLLGFATRLLLGFLALALEARRLLLGAEDPVPLGDDVADRGGDRRTRADRVIVARDHVVDPLGVAIGVDQPDDRNPQALGLTNRDRLGLEVDHEHRIGDALHVLDAAEIGAQLLEVGVGRHPLARRQQLQLSLGLVALEVVQTPDPERDRLEVGQQTAEPTMVDVGHLGRIGRVLDRVASLLLGPDEQDGAAAA